MSETKKLYKSKIDRKIAGVCGGIAEYLELDSTLIRLIWVITVFCAGGGLIAYLLAALILSDKPADVKL